MKSRWPYVLAAAFAFAVAANYAVQTLAAGPRLGFPLDDAYIYMTYAKQIARGHPFTYFDGGGYSAGATSMLWPLILSPLWAIGFRDHLFVWAVFVFAASLLAVTSCLLLALARRILGPVQGSAAGILAVVLVVSSGTASWSYLSGMEVSLCGTLLLVVVGRLLEEGPAPPSRGLLLLLAATALARPEAGLLVAGLGAVRAAVALRRRDPGTALRWLSPLLAPALVAATNRLLAGHAAPNTAIAKSYFYLPGFDWSFWAHTVLMEGRALLDAVFWSGADGLEPVLWPKLTLLAWLAGAARLLFWARREDRWAGILVLVLAPWTIFAAVIFTSGQWHFHNYRYIASALPPLLLVCALGLAPPRRLHGRALPLALGALLAAGALWGGRGFLQRDVLIFAQSARDVNAHVVAVGRWIDANLPPDAYVAFHDVGAIGYYSNRRLIDIIGLISNGQAEICNQGPGTRFEFFERLPPDRRPGYFAYYPGWLLTGSRDLFGKTLFAAQLPPPLAKVPRLIGGAVMEVIEARWDLLGSGAAPLDAGGWTVVDEVDVADLVSEAGHHYHGDLGRRELNTPTANWSVYYSAVHDGRTIADGGRTVRGPGGERMTIAADPGRPLRLVVRTGGPTTLPYSSVPATARTLLVKTEDGRELGRLRTPVPAPDFAETTLELPADPARPPRLSIVVTASDGKPYRVYHWYVLQPPVDKPPPPG